MSIFTKFSKHLKYTHQQPEPSPIDALVHYATLNACLPLLAHYMSVTTVFLLHLPWTLAWVVFVFIITVGILCQISVTSHSHVKVEVI